MFLAKSFIFLVLEFAILEGFLIKTEQRDCSYRKKDGNFLSNLSDSSNGSSCKIRDILRKHHLRSVSSLQQIHYVVQNAVIESIVDLMVYWKRFRGVVLLDDHSGLTASVLKNYFTEFQINIKVYLINSTVVLEGLIEEIATTRSNIIVICNKSYTTSVLNVAIRQNLFNRTVSWIILGESVPDQLFHVEIKPNSQVTLTVPVSTEAGSINDEIHFFDVFFGYATRRIESIRFALWNVRRRLAVLEFLDCKDRAHGLLGRLSSTVVFEHPPFTILSYDKNGTLQITGNVLDFVSMTLQSLKMQYTVRKVEPVFGMAVNGTYTGFLGMLYRKEADFSFNVLAMISSRRVAVRYVGPVVKGYLGIFYNRPKPFMPPTAYFFPFSLQVWIVTLVICVVLIAAVAVAWFMSRVYFDGQHWSRLTLVKIISGDFIVEVFENPKGLLTKVVYGTLLVTVILLFNYYTSVFTSFLTHREEDLPFVDLEGVVANPDYKVLLVRDTRYEVLFSTATSGVYSDIWKKVLLAGGRDWFPSTFQEGYEMMTTGKYALPTEGSSTMYMAYDNCNVALASRIYSKEFYFMTTRHDFPFSSFIRLGLLRAMEGGIYVRLSRKYKLEGRPPCSTTTKSSSLGLDQVVGVFFVWGCGILLSVFSLLLEMTILRKFA